MNKADTIIVVGVTRLDEYRNLWVTPQGDGEEVKIGVKRQHLHPLFEQGKAVLLHWETYQNRPYVADAKLVEGELPPPQKPYEAPAIIPRTVKPDRDLTIEAQVAIKSITEIFVADKIEELMTSTNQFVTALRVWLSEKLNPYMMPQTTAEPLTHFQKMDELKKKQTEIEPTATTEPIEGLITLDQLKEKIAKKMGWKQSTTAYSFMVNKCKLTEEALNTNPTECWEQIKQLQGWTD